MWTICLSPSGRFNQVLSSNWAWVYFEDMASFCLEYSNILLKICSMVGIVEHGGYQAQVRKPAFIQVCAKRET